MADLRELERTPQRIQFKNIPSIQQTTEDSNHFAAWDIYMSNWKLKTQIYARGVQSPSPLLLCTSKTEQRGGTHRLLIESSILDQLEVAALVYANWSILPLTASMLAPACFSSTFPFFMYRKVGIELTSYLADRSLLVSTSTLRNTT